MECHKKKRILYLGLDPSSYLDKGDVTHWPVIEIAPRPLSDPQIQATLKNFNIYTHIIITSKSTIPILLGALSYFGIDLQKWNEKKTLAVGQSTAKKLAEQGIANVLIAKEETAEGLVEELKLLDLGKAHFFLPQSAQARPVLSNFFFQHQIPFSCCHLYEPKTVVCSSLPHLDEYDEIIFTSPSTVRSFLEIFGQFPTKPHLKTIGPITKKILETFF